MPDNVQANPGVGGATFASDEIAGVHHPRSKVEWGPDGTATDTDDADGKRLPVQPARAGTGTVPAQISDSVTSVTLLAANANRKGATIHNGSTAILYVKLGAAATLTSFTAKLVQDAYYEVPYGYIGVIDGIWSADAGGLATVTELT